MVVGLVSTALEHEAVCAVRLSNLKRGRPEHGGIVGTVHRFVRCRSALPRHTEQIGVVEMDLAQKLLHARFALPRRRLKRIMQLARRLGSYVGKRRLEQKVAFVHKPPHALLLIPF